MAKKFKFRVEPVLKLREQTERMALRELAHARQHATAIEQRIRGIRDELNAQDALVREGVLTGTVDVQYMSLYRRHVMTLHRRIIEQVTELRQAATAAQRCRVKVVDAVKQRKILSALKDKLQLRHRKEAERQEQNDMDELTSMQSGHRRLAEEER